MHDQQLEGSSYWTTATPMPEFAALTRAPDVDVVVVGGGIAGITAAHLIKQSGLRVALLERHRCGSGQTGRSTAHLTAVTDVPLVRLVERLGADRARRLWDAGFSAISRVRAEVRDQRINCDFAWVRGCLHAPVDQDLRAARVALNNEASIANALGISAAYADHVPGLARPGVWFDGQARLHPLRYLSVLLDRIDGDGSHVFEHTEVDGIDPVNMTVEAAGVTVAASRIVLATHVPPRWLPDDGERMRPRVDLNTSYVVSGIAPSGPMGEGLYWEHRDAPYEYLRVDRQEHHDLVIFGGLDHAGNQAASSADRFARLERRLAQRVLGVRVEHRWAGQVAEPADGRPYIGEVAAGVFLATGFGGNGMTFGTLAGMIAADAARGIDNPWGDLFDVNRSNVVAGPWQALTEAS